MDPGDLTPKIVINEMPVNSDAAGVVYRDEEGRRHREDGPALSLPDGTQLWYCHGRKHRPDGPAVIQSDGHQEWWIHGERVPERYEQAFAEACSNLNPNVSEMLIKTLLVPIRQAMHPLNSDKMANDMIKDLKSRG